MLQPATLQLQLLSSWAWASAWSMSPISIRPSQPRRREIQWHRPPMRTTTLPAVVGAAGHSPLPLVLLATAEVAVDCPRGCQCHPSVRFPMFAATGCTGKGGLAALLPLAATTTALPAAALQASSTAAVLPAPCRMGLDPRPALRLLLRTSTTTTATTLIIEA